MQRRIGLGILLAVALGAGTAVGDPRVVTPREADQMRIRRHLSQVEQALRAVDTAGLTEAQKANRASNLDALHSYWVRGEFPENTNHPGKRVPTFIDERGTACAAGHLIIASGAEPLAEAIDRRHHNDYVKDMRGADLAAWITESGLSADEVALIQPGYCACGYTGPYLDGGAEPQVPDGGGPQPYQPVCGTDGLTYWNRCAAEMCGDVAVAYDGKCGIDGGVCTTAQFGNDVPVVDSCIDHYAMVCDQTGGNGVKTADDYTAKTWLAEQQNDCADAAVGTGGNAGSGGYAGSTGTGGSPSDAGTTDAGTADAGVRRASDDDGGCAIAQRRPAPARDALALLLGVATLALGARRRKRRATRSGYSAS